jgi:hypothetical protein
MTSLQDVNPSLRELWSWASCPWLFVLTEILEQFRSNIISIVFLFNLYFTLPPSIDPSIPLDHHVTIIIAPRRRSPFILPSMPPDNQVPVRRASLTPAVACSVHKSAQTMTRRIIEIRSGLLSQVDSEDFAEHSEMHRLSLIR